MVKLGQGPCRIIPGGRDREPAQPDTEDHDQHDPRHELGHYGGRQTHDRQDAVRGAATVQGGHHAAQNTQRHDQHEGHRRKFGRIQQRGRQKRGHRRAISIGLPQIPRHKARDPVAILHQKRAVGAHFMVQHIDRRLIGKGPQHRAADIPGQKMPACKDQHAEQP